LEERFFKDFHEERKEAEEEAKRKEEARKAERRKALALVREVERRKVSTSTCRRFSSRRVFNDGTLTGRRQGHRVIHHC
jgi:hypothetical protein